VLVLGGIGILSLLGRHETTAPPAPAPVVAAAPVEAIPTGAGITTAVVEGKPEVSIYFDTAKSDIYPNFEARTEELRTYFAAHPDTHLQVSGYNDPRGDAAFNAALSKARAFAVRDALAKLGVTITSIALIKPVNTTDDTDSLAHARRVDVTVEDGPADPADVPAVDPTAAVAPTTTPAQ
jgi:outer membrane protein OmpA-like peptidoglycan-associated protein